MNIVSFLKDNPIATIQKGKYRIFYHKLLFHCVRINANGSRTQIQSSMDLDITISALVYEEAQETV